ncbi:MAG: hypothetical protein V4671_30235 [Armatimonadota bacterium]
MQNTQTPAILPRGGRSVLSPRVAFAALVGILVAVAAPQPALAQRSNNSNILPIRLKLGVFLPSDRDTRKVSGSTHLSGEVDVALPFSDRSGAQTFLSVGFSKRNGTGFGIGSSYQVIPISLTQISSPQNPVGRVTGSIYYGAGVGLYFVKVTGLVRAASVGSFVYSKSRALIGTSLVAGYQTPASFFIEGKYHVVTGTVEGYSPNGLSVFVGKRL